MASCASTVSTRNSLHVFCKRLLTGFSMFADMTKTVDRNTWKPIGHVLRGIAGKLAAQKISRGLPGAPGGANGTPGDAAEADMGERAPQREAETTQNPSSVEAASAGFVRVGPGHGLAHLRRSSRASILDLPAKAMSVRLNSAAFLMPLKIVV